MSKKRIVFIGFGLFTVFAAFVVMNFTGASNAKSMNLEERFETLSTNEKLTKAETKGEYSIDKAHSYIGFKVWHMGLAEVPGSFNSFEGTINFDSEKIKNSSVEFTADVKSVDTRVGGRDNHLRSKDFFEVATYPELTFKSTRIKKKGKKLKVYGNLTMRGVTKEVMIPARLYGPIKDARGNIKMGIQGETKINRRAFNINYGGDLPNGTQVISDLVTIDLQLETAMKKEKEKETAKSN